MEPADTVEYGRGKRVGMQHESSTAIPLCREVFGRQTAGGHVVGNHVTVIESGQVAVHKHKRHRPVRGHPCAVVRMPVAQRKEDDARAASLDRLLDQGAFLATALIGTQKDRLVPFLFQYFLGAEKEL